MRASPKNTPTCHLLLYPFTQRAADSYYGFWVINDMNCRYSFRSQLVHLSNSVMNKCIYFSTLENVDNPPVVQRISVHSFPSIFTQFCQILHISLSFCQMLNLTKNLYFSVLDLLIFPYNSLNSTTQFVYWFFFDIFVFCWKCVQLSQCLCLTLCRLSSKRRLHFQDYRNICTYNDKTLCQLFLHFIVYHNVNYKGANVF